MKMMGSVGSFVGPYFIGVTFDAFGSFMPAMLLLALCLLGASAMQLLFREPGKHSRCLAIPISMQHF